MGEHIILQPVYLFLLPFREEKGFQYAENGFPLPAAVFPAAFSGEETDQTVQKHHQGMVVHRMLPVDESGNFIALEGPLQCIVIILWVSEKDKNIPETEMPVPHQGQNGSGNEIHFLSPVGGGDEVKPFVGCRGGCWRKGRMVCPPVEEKAGHRFQAGRSKAAVLGQENG